MFEIDEEENRSTEGVHVNKVNDVHVQIQANRGVLMELSDFFTFTVPGSQFMPLVKNGLWDGKIRMLNVNNGLIYAGVLPYIVKFCEERGYKISLDNELQEGKDVVTKDELKQFLKNCPMPFKPKPHQIEALKHIIENKRTLIISPTASGKSFILYLALQYLNKRTLVVVPTTSLVYQMRDDLIEYGYSPDDIHIIMSGKEKDTDKQVVISTWQSIYKLGYDFFEPFDIVFGDEAHNFKAKSLSTLMSKLVDCEYRVGMTGTLDGTQVHQLMLEGLFGTVKRIISTKELMNRGDVSDLKIKTIVLKHPATCRKEMSKSSYHDEMEYICMSQPRNEFIVDLASKLKGNTLILFQFIEKHGKPLYDMMSGMENVHFVHGAVDAGNRETIRKTVEKSNDAIVIASYGTFSTGINIKKLNNIVFASPSKSQIRVLQSIGRGLRTHDDKDKATLIDIGDDMRWGKSWTNHTLKHLHHRINIYNKENFEYTIHNINLKE